MESAVTSDKKPRAKRRKSPTKMNDVELIETLQAYVPDSHSIPDKIYAGSLKAETLERMRRGPSRVKEKTTTAS